MSNNLNVGGRNIIFCLGMSLMAVACSSSIPIVKLSPVSSTILADPTTSPAALDQPGISTSTPFIPNPSPTSTTPVPSFDTPTITPELTPSPTSPPPYSILRGTVLVQAHCRYGPGAAYLYKYGLYPGNHLEIIGRNEPGSWIVIQAIGGTEPCWVKASLLEIQGDVMTLAPASLPLPQSPYYGPVTGLSAVRVGESVVISWDAITLKDGDDSLQYPYLIEAWVCQDDQLIFTPLGSWETTLTVQDESGCSEPSHARVFGVEKHGYTAWVAVSWPQP